MKKKALLIGNSDFTDPHIEALFAPRNDIEELRDLLEDEDIGDFDSVVCKFDVGYSDFKLAISRLFKNASKDDLIVFYYAGHGIRDEDGELYLASPETRSDNIDASALEAQYVLDKLRKSRSQKKVVILDCCHAGAVVAEGDYTLSRSTVDDAMLKENFVPKGEGTYVLAACKAGASAFESTITHRSVYTSKFIEAIKTGLAAPESEVLTIPDIHDYIRRERLHNKDLDSSNPHTEPMMIGTQTDALEFCKNPSVRRPIDPHLLESLSDENPSARIGAAMQLGNLVTGDDKFLAESARTSLEKQLDLEKHLDVHKAITKILDRPESKAKLKPVMPEPAEPVSASTKLQSDTKATGADAEEELSFGEDFKKAMVTAYKPNLWWLPHAKKLLNSGQKNTVKPTPKPVKSAAPQSSPTVQDDPEPVQWEWQKKNNTPKKKKPLWLRIIIYLIVGYLVLAFIGVMLYGY